MNRLPMIATGHDAPKRVGLIVMSLFLMAGCCIALGSSKVLASACAAPTTDFGSATATVKIDTAGTYQIWSRLSAADSSNNSYLLEVDGSTCYVVGDSNNLIPNTWTWVDYQNGSGTSSKTQQHLDAGTHTLKMIGREAGVKLGRILLVSDLNCKPVDNGDNCAVAGDLEAPTVSLTTPATGSNVSGSVNITASASDNVGVAKVEFYVNGALAFTDTSAPFSYTWDSTAVANGTVSLTAKAYDVAGNANADTVQVQVANGDTQAPTVPNSVSATANAYNKVTVAWSASTDNTGVSGYRIARNGVTVAQVTNGTQYVDNTVLPNMTYSYRVSAYDAAGNSSGLSAAAQVTTPNQADSQAPTAPANLSATAVSPTQVNLSWSASSDNIGVAAYDVYRSVGSGSGVKVASVSDLSYGDTGLAPSTSYSYYVIARDSAGNTSTQSPTVATQTQAQPPAATTGSLKGKVTFNRSRDNHASIVILINGVKHIYSTDQNGNYLIVDLPPSTYRVRYQARGSFSKEVTIKIEASKTKTQDVILRQR